MSSESWATPSNRPVEITSPISGRDRADAVQALIKTAYERHDKLTETAWKLRLSVWTAFGIATGFVVNAEAWRPTWSECIVGCLLTITIVVVVIFLWGPFSYRRVARLSRVAAYWEAELEKIVNISLPDYLRVKNWLPETGGHAPDDPLQKWYLQRVYLSHALITLAFGLFMMLALLSKMRG